MKEVSKDSVLLGHDTASMGNRF